ncbi:TPA: discoidin domain-containing protein [Streptococcus suis]|nr:discoidin domain-containing protein [Streptococcus suis]
MSQYSKYLFDKRYRFSIRRLAVGVASVAIGCSLFGGQSVFAETGLEGEDTISNQLSPEEASEESTVGEVAEEVGGVVTDSSPVANLEEETGEVAEGTETVESEVPVLSADTRGGSDNLASNSEVERMEFAPAAQPTAVSPSPTTELPSHQGDASFSKPATAVGAITGLTFDNGVATIRYQTGEQAQVSLYNDHVFRYYIDKTGDFQEHPAPSREDRPATITVKSLEAYRQDYQQVGRMLEEEHRYILETEKIWIFFDKATARMSVFDRLANKYVTKEVLPVQITPTQTSQVLSQDENEFFFGGGMQNGRFSHKGQKINIVNENNWVDGGVASPSPFYWSTNGYGVLRNTFQRGFYDFGTEQADQVETKHLEGRFDSYFFINSSPTAIIKDYQELTGAPVVLPEYALYLGHLNAYNRDYWVEVAEGTRGAIKLGDKWYREYQPQHLPEADRANAFKETLNGEGNSYLFSAKAVIDRYEEQNMPLAWFLPNDGYGAGYGQTDSLDGNIANLKKFVDYAKSKGIQVGLWTQSDLVDTNPSKEVVLHRDIDKEVMEAGIRAIKTDVAWVGPGYSFGLNGVDEGAKRITNGSGAEQARPFIVSLDGWGGTQRSAAIWSGDQSGGEWEYIRFHIPTYIGLGLSGNPNMGSDMDGIFGGADPIINARDYQWKMFTSIMMNMDGWGAKPKTPFSFDDRTTDINRISLKQKSTLMPYAYSLGHEARETGKPIVRAMFIEFPDEVINYGKDVRYQYMYGSNLLVVPIYKNTAMQANGDDIRNNIYLPGGEDQEWIDWYTGQKYKGGQVLNGFAAPLWKAPVFVRNGAIIPMTNANNNPGEIDRTKRVIQFYPHGDSSFTLYEDDGKSVGYQAGQLAKTVISSQAGDSNEKGRAVLTIGATEGSFPGFIKEKTTELHVNVSEDVDAVTVRVGNQDVTLRRVNSLEEYEAGSDVFFYHANPLMPTYNPKSTDIQHLRVEMNDLLKIKLAARDVTQAAVVVTIDGVVHQNPVAEVPANLQVPMIPTGLTAPEEGISATSIRLQWTGVEGASSYDILRDGTLFTGITGTNFTFDDFAYGSEHSFKIRAVNAKGASAWSQELRVATNENPWSDAIDGIQATTNITPQDGQGLDKLFDKQVGHQFHSQWGVAVNFPATISMDLGGTYEVDRIEYYPRNDVGSNGRITKAYFEVSEDGVNWTTDSYYSVWANDNKTKTYKFAVPRVRYIRMHIAEGVNNFVSGEELLVFKKPGSRMLIPGDISNDGRISDDDKTSFLNYSGLRTEDSDFGYISHADSNKNGLIDAYDISVAAVQLEGGIATPSQSNPAGRTYLTADKLDLTAGQTTTIRLMAADLEAVNALTSTVMIDGSQFEVVGQVTANQTFTKEAENFSYVRTRGNQSNIVFSFVNFGDKPQLTGSGEIGRITLRALKDGQLDLTLQDGILVSNNLRTKALADSAIRQAVTYTTVPAVPSQIASNRLTSGSATLTWTGDKQAFEYLIEQETADGFVPVGQTDQTSLTVYNLAPESTYRFRVKAKNRLGTSEASEVVSLVTPVKDAIRKVPIVLATTPIADQEGTELTYFIDGNDTTLYHSSWANRQAVPSHIVLDLGQVKDIDHILYRPRNNAGNGTITSVKLSISHDGEEWEEVTAPIAWAVNNTEKVALLPEGSKARFIKVHWLASVGGFVSGKEIAVYGPAASPIQPEAPVQPDQPTEPEVPVQPEQPTDPEVPVQPEQPTEPEVPVQPEQPTDPESPVQPGQPTDSESPVQPDQPVGDALNTADLTVALQSLQALKQTALTEKEQSDIAELLAGAELALESKSQEAIDEIGLIITDWLANRVKDSSSDQVEDTKPDTPADQNTSGENPVSETEEKPDNSSATKPVYEEVHSLVDTQTGLRVELESGESKSITGLKVELLESGTAQTPEVLLGQDFDLYSIELINSENQVVQPTKDTLVILPVDKDKQVERVVYLPQPHQAEEIDFVETIIKNADGSEQAAIAFVAKHFSYYGLIYKEARANGGGVQAEELPKADLPTPEVELITAKGESVTYQLPALDMNAFLSKKEVGEKLVVNPVKAMPAEKKLPSTGESSSEVAIVGMTVLGLLGYAVRRRQLKN